MSKAKIKERYTEAMKMARFYAKEARQGVRDRDLDEATLMFWSASASAAHAEGLAEAAELAGLLTEFECKEMPDRAIKFQEDNLAGLRLQILRKFQ